MNLNRNTLNDSSVKVGGDNVEATFLDFSQEVTKVLGKRKIAESKINEIISLLPKKPCPDQQVGKIGEIFQKECGVCSNPFRRDEIIYSDQKRVVIILESPHEKEYQQIDKDWEPIGPACGCTGCRLARNWRNVFGDRFLDSELILMNVIRFQCSLASAGSYKKYKNAILKGCLENEMFVSDFKNRVLKLRNKRTVFINACTGGGGRSSANKKVSGFLSSWKIDAVSLWHPSVWICPKVVEKQHDRISTCFPETDTLEYRTTL